MTSPPAHHDVESPVAAVLRYAASGWPVLPCRQDKTPHTRHGVLDASTDPAVIGRWWTRWPAALPAVATGQHLTVLDIDVKGPANGYTALRAVEHLLPTGCPRVRTPSGGLHVYTRPRAPVGNRSLRTAGVDVRGDGGYVLVPPGVTDHGSYEFAERGSWPVPTVDVRRVLDVLAPPPRPSPPRGFDRGGDPVRWLAPWVENLQPGGRNAGLFWAACCVAEHGHDPHPLIEAAVNAGLPRGEATRTIRSAVRTATSKAAPAAPRHPAAAPERD